MQRVFGDEALLEGAFAFELALADALAEVGLVPPSLAASMRTLDLEADFPVAALATEAARAGAFPIPFVERLTRKVREIDPVAAGFVHQGATSQDVADTALVLQLQRAVSFLVGDGGRLARALAGLATAHRATLMTGRTLLQPATPVTLGLKAAGWLLGVTDAIERIRIEAAGALQLQLGGAAGTLAPFGDRGIEIASRMAASLRLACPPLPWHTRRGQLVGLTGAVAILSGVLGKLARDISLLMQAEVAEVSEPGGHGRGGSSAMPHKRNPTASMTALAAAARTPSLQATLLGAMVQEHERALGGWQAEAPTIAALFEATHAALLAMIEAIDGLRVSEAAMRANLDALRGLTMAERLMLALAPSLGRDEAKALVERLAARVIETGSSMIEVAKAEDLVQARLSTAALEALFDPASYLGSAGAFVDRALEAASRSAILGED